MKNTILTIFFFLLAIISLAQNKHTISGYIQDESSGENLIGVSIYDKENYKGTASNQYGFYSLSIEEEIM